MAEKLDDYLILISVANLREKDVARMENLKEMMAGGEIVDLIPSFPALTCPVQANMTTGRPPKRHGIIANGIYWRDRDEVEMWTSPNDCIEVPQLWDLLYHHERGLTSAIWFPQHAKEAGADFICTPAPIHNPDGSETMWCYTRPENLYGELRQKLGDFPLHRYWGPLANIESTRWIVESAIELAKAARPNLFYIYLPHLDYAAQKDGPDSVAAGKAVLELDEVLGQLMNGLRDAYDGDPCWLIAGEYAITPVERVIYPNRILREAGLLSVREERDGEYLDTTSAAWALADHQIAHVFVRDGEPEIIDRVMRLFQGLPGIDEVLAGEQRSKYHMDHPRSGEVILTAQPDTWFAYYYWFEDHKAPPFARKVDIHRKPGYDPVELFFDPATRGIPLKPELVHGSHGALVRERFQRTVAISSRPGVFPREPVTDTDIFHVVLKHFGMTMDGLA